MGYRRFIAIDPSGSVIRDRLAGEKPPGDWIEVPKAQQHMLGLDPRRLRWCETEGLCAKQRIRLSVGALIWPGDGEAVNAIGVRGDALDPDTLVNVRVNNTDYKISKSDDLMLTSTPGFYTVRVVDPYYYAVPGSVTIQATEVEDAQS